MSTTAAVGSATLDTPQQEIVTLYHNHPGHSLAVFVTLYHVTHPVVRVHGQ